MIQFKHINLTFKDNELFTDFNLIINKNDKILLNAPSGSGKTTLMKLILGFVKPDAGDIFVDGTLLKPKTIKDIRKKIAYVSQDVDFHNLKVANLLDEILSYKINNNLNVTDEYIREVFATFNIEHILYKMIDEISGGERQRLGLAVAILLDRPILLIDEVTSGLDEKMKETVINYLMNSEKTIIIISHDRLWNHHEEIKVVEW